jgi:hypothetical protein
VSHPNFYDPLYLTKPVVFELQHYRIVKDDGNWLGKNGSDTISQYGHSGAEIMSKAIETLHATFIGYHGFLEEWFADNPDLTNKLANLCGYWYFPESASFRKVFVKGNNIIAMVWQNKGVAPAYNDFNIIFRLENTNKGYIIDTQIDNAGNTKWIPGYPVKQEYMLNIDENVQSGRYTLKFKLVQVKPEYPVMIDIGLKKECFDKDGFVELGKIRLAGRSFKRSDLNS